MFSTNEKAAQEEVQRLHQGIEKGKEVLADIYPRKVEGAISDAKNAIESLVKNNVDAILGPFKAKYDEFKKLYEDAKGGLDGHAKKVIETVFPKDAQDAPGKIQAEIDKAKELLKKLKVDEIQKQIAEIEKTLEDIQQNELKVQVEATVKTNVAVDEIAKVSKELQDQAQLALKTVRDFQMTAKTDGLKKAAEDAAKQFDKFKPDALKEGIETAKKTIEEIAQGKIDMSVKVTMPEKPIDESEAAEEEEPAAEAA